MPYIETVSEFVEYLADMIYGCHNPSGGVVFDGSNVSDDKDWDRNSAPPVSANDWVVPKGFECPCRICWTARMNRRIEDIVKYEVSIRCCQHKRERKCL